MNFKQSLIKITFELYLKYGVKSVTMDDISKKLGISKKTIYSCVKNKEDLINATLESYLKKDQQDIKYIHQNSNDAIDEMVNITKHVLVFLRHMTPSLIYDLKKYYPLAWKKVENQHFTFIQQIINNNLERGQKEGLYREDMDIDVIAKLYVTKSHSITNEDDFPLTKYDRISLFKEMIAYHLYGIVSDLGRTKLKDISLN